MMAVSNSNTSVNVTWSSSVVPPSAMGSIITGYQVEAFIVDINMNESNQTVSVDNVTSTELEMLSELELCPTLGCMVTCLSVNMVPSRCMESPVAPTILYVVT